MSIEVDYNDRDATFTVAPEHGRTVVFEVRLRMVQVGRSRHNLQYRYVVGLKGSDGPGFIAHTSFERACRSALWRARRYQKAYSEPHGVAAPRVLQEAS